MVFFVSGEDRTTIEGFLNQSVRLPCNCSRRNLKEEFRWQIERTDDVPEVLFNYNGTYNEHEKYKERVHSSSPEGSRNCDIFLTNITAEDQGIYVCSFWRPGYTRIFVDLKVYATYNIYVKDPKVFHCDVQGHYGDAEIRWRLAEDFLTNSTVDDLTHYDLWNASTGLHQFHSIFITHRNLTAPPSCHVEAKYKLTNIKTCETKTGSLAGPQEIPQNSRRVFVIISLTLVLGVFIFLCHRFTSTRRRQEQFLYKNTENHCDSVSTLPG